MNARLPTLDPLRQSRLLAARLRLERLTILCGEGDAGSSALLKVGLLPLLQRRSADLAAALGWPLQSRPHSPDRRAIGPASATATTSAAEITVVVDAWSGPPLAQLRRHLRLAVPSALAAEMAPLPRLADALRLAHDQLGARFLFILDRCGECLAATPERDGADEGFDEALIDVVNDAALPAHFLLLAGAQAEPLIERFEGRIGGLADPVVRLAPARPASRPVTIDGQAVAAEAAAANEPVVSIEAVYSSIQTTLARIAADRPEPPWQPASADAAVAAPAPAVETSEAPAPAAVVTPAPAAPAVPDTPVAAAVVVARPRRLWPAAALASLAFAVLAAWLWPAEPPPQAPASAAAPVSVAAPGVTQPPAPAFAAELAELLGLAGRGGDAVAPAAGGWAEALAFRPGAPRLVVARHDAVQAARADPATPALRIVAPLALDEVLFVVRAGVPGAPAFLHEIAGRPLDAGPAAGARALTAGTVHRRLFGAAPAAWADAAPTEAAALQRLAAGNGADVVVVIGAQTLDAWATTHPDAMRQLKLLGVDRQHNASRKALQAYLPVTLRAAEHRHWLAEDTPVLAAMSFLVTSAAAEAADPAFIDRFARTLCERLPLLQRGGDPKWRDVAPQLELPAGWPYSAVAARAFAACATPDPQISQAPQPEGVRP